MIGRILNFIKKHRRLVFGLLILLVIFFVWRQSQRLQNQPALQTAKVERGDLVSTVTASGQVATTGRITITSQASGLVKKVLVNNGQSVRAGDSIIELELDSVSQAKQAGAWSSYLSAKTALDAARVTNYTLQSDLQTKWKKFFDLATSGPYQNSDGSAREDIRNSSAEFNSAQADFKAAEAKFKNQQAVIAQTQSGISATWLDYQNSSPLVTAPIDGTVSDLILVPGMVVGAVSSGTTTASTKIATITTNGPTIVSFNLSEVDVLKVKPDQEVSVAVDSFPNQTFKARVVGIDKTGVVASGVTNYPAIIELDETPASILPAMSATATIIIARKDNVLLVPSSAVVTLNGQSVVRVQNEGQARPTSVEIGDVSDTQTEIISGIMEGDLVVTGTTTTSAPAGTPTSPFNTQFRFGQGAGGGGTRRPQ